MDRSAVGGQVASAPTAAGDGCPRLSSRAALLRDEVFALRREIDHRRAVAVTRAYRRTEGRPVLERRAAALRAALEASPPHLGVRELIVGTLAGEPHRVPLFPEFSCRWILSELDTLPTRPVDCYAVGEETKRALQEALPWWDGRTVQELAEARFEPAALNSMTAGPILLVSLTSGIGHMVVDYASVVRRGLRAMVEDAAREADDPDNPLARSARECVRALGEWAGRYEALASEMAAAEPDAGRRRELELVADHCSRVPLEPSRTFHEALQSVFFCQVALQLESNGHSVCFDRFDQALWPLLSADLQEGRLTEADALELLQCLFIKLTALDKLMSEPVSTLYAGHSLFQSLTVGGVDAAGRDACNPLTMLVLQAQETVAMHQPSLTFRFHPGTPPQVTDQLVRTLAVGTGMPSVFNDATCRELLESWGVPAGENWNYAVQGCIKPSVAGRNGEDYDAGWVSLPKCLELALHGGRDPRTGLQLGPATPPADEMRSFEDLLSAYREQVRYFVGLVAGAHNQLERTHAEHCPTPLLSAFVPSCLRRGVPLQAGGADYNHCSLLAVGLACAADSLAAVRREAFERRTLTVGELVHVLDSDFEGQEVLRQRLLRRSPKYGNDDPRADELAAWCMSTFAQDAAAQAVVDFKGGYFRAGSLTVTLHVGMGTFVGATPDGRRAGEPLSDGGVSPMYGRDAKGPTALLRSVAHLDHPHLAGTLLNMKFHPSALAGDGGRRNMGGFIRTFGELGLQHVQFNVVDAATLRAAQKHPELHSNLVVRVAGYSARFVELGRNVQDDIIARTEHVF